MGPEELVGAEENLLIGGDGVDDVDRIGTRAAHIGLRLDGRRGVDVAHHDRAGVLGLPRSQLVGGDAVGQGATGGGVRNEHPLVGGEQLGGLCHEVHPGEDNRRGVRRGGDPGQRQGIADVIGDVLDLGILIVVGKDDGILPVCLPAHLLRPGHRRRRGHGTSPSDGY